MIELKPCPFCGHTPVLIIKDNYAEVRCRHCGANFYRAVDAYCCVRDEVVNSWNRRTKNNSN